MGCSWWFAGGFPPSSFTDRLDWVSDCQASIIHGVQGTLWTLTHNIYFAKHENKTFCKWGKLFVVLYGGGGVSLYSIPGGIVPSLGDQEGPRGGNHMPECTVQGSPRERELADSQMCHLLVTTTNLLVDDVFSWHGTEMNERIRTGSRMRYIQS